jgi:hypothetical protein
MAHDKWGRDVYLAESEYSLRMAQEKFTDIKVSLYVGVLILNFSTSASKNLFRLDEIFQAQSMYSVHSRERKSLQVKSTPYLYLLFTTIRFKHVY